ncbi:MAG: glycoside hydrolase family 1 protein [bacterium]|nr:glycoside hydrolase family 1 protein [bacterium]
MEKNDLGNVASNTDFKFPEGFLWGAATSAHQVEGTNNNDWTEWEKKNALRLASEAKSKFGHLPNWKDIEKEATNPNNYISGIACDHYNRYQEDFDLAKSLGHNAHRFSIEWSRIEPEEGKFDEVAIEHYRDVIKALRERGIEPFVTLWHWTIPLWASKRGGWENKEIVEKFFKYADCLSREYKDLVKFWMPLNEPGTYVGMSYIQGAFPPRRRFALFTANRVFKNLMKAYRKSYKIIHRNIPGSQVGMSHYAVYMFPYKNRAWNKFIVKILDYYRNWRFLNLVNDSNDFIGIQYYHTDNINFSPLMNGKWGFIDTKNKNSWITDMGWDIYPEGIYHLLKRAGKYNKSIYITENGIADKKDLEREKFIKENLKWVKKALGEGVDIRGYFHWSLLDNFEWDKGFWPRFGLVEINRNTLERKIRPSALVYRDIIKKNSL